METDLMFSWVYVDIHLMRIDFQIQHKSGLLIGSQLIFTGLADSMVDQPISHHPTIHITVLDFCQCCRCVVRIGHPAAQRQITMLPFNRQRMLQKRRAANRAQPALFLPIHGHCPVLTHHFAVVRQINRHIKTRQRNAANNLVDMIKFSFLGAHKFAPRRGVVEQI